MTDTPPSAREAVRQALDTVTGYGTKPSTDLFLEALRSRGYEIVPREPTPEMRGAWDAAAVHEEVYAEGGTVMFVPTHDLDDVWPSLIRASNASVPEGHHPQSEAP